ncbi:MLO-like protein [Vigna angularis]|uniref:MLO-like protein n=1 Tax=Phaseolus angularis TaxID=3914 RepID=A0A8T0KDC5_PHAAN|nr:MLO-like protein [Vigna angularis]
MAGGGGGRNLEETPTWAVSTVCFVLILISIIIEHIIHLIGKWLKKKHKRALYESLEKIKSELMLLGFLSLLLTVGQGLISRICISEKVASTWHPCSHENTDTEESEQGTNSRRLLAAFHGSNEVTPRRVLAGGGSDKCGEGKVPFVSSDGIHQLHIFIFVLTVFHVLYCITTMALGRAKMKRWKRWEEETKTPEYQFSHDPERFRFARETSFGRRHLSFWTKNPVLMWIVCFFRQFVRSVPKVDYLTLRHGFIMSSILVLRGAVSSLEHSWLVLLSIILLVGTKLQVIITEMGLRIQQRGEILKGVPLVQPGDYLFWFNRPALVLYLINFVLFQNAFQLAFFSWSALQFGIKSCFHAHTEDVVIRISMGYVTLPLYALVTQMGSTMKPTIFNERVAEALRKWHQTAKKQIRQNRVGPLSLSGTPMSSRPTTPSHHMSPMHLLRYYRSEIDSFPASPRRSNFDGDHTQPWEIDSPSPSYSQHEVEMGPTNDPNTNTSQHEIVTVAHTKEFSFDNRPTTAT